MMANAEARAQPQFYFSLPRLLVKMRGGNARRTEQSLFEVHFAGGTIQLIAHLFAWRHLLEGLSLAVQLVLLIPLVVLVWIGWQIVLYLNLQVTKLLRAVGFLRQVPDDRVQSVLIGIMITAFACELLFAGQWLKILGGLWLVVVALNLVAALWLWLVKIDSEPSQQGQF